MKIDFSKPITNINGEIISDLASQANPKPALLLGKVACEALLSTYQDEMSLSGEAKFKRFKLAEAVIKCEISEMSAEDVSEIKRLIGKAYGPVVVGRAYEIIEGNGA